MSKDRELLELAAKAAGFGHADPQDNWRVVVPANWNPLTDNGDALELAARLNMNILIHAPENSSYPFSVSARPQRLEGVGSGYRMKPSILLSPSRYVPVETEQFLHPDAPLSSADRIGLGVYPDQLAATRRAIVRAAAAIGKEMKA